MRAPASPGCVNRSPLRANAFACAADTESAGTAAQHSAICAAADTTASTAKIRGATEPFTAAAADPPAERDCKRGGDPAGRDDAIAGEINGQQGEVKGGDEGEKEIHLLASILQKRHENRLLQTAYHIRPGNAITERSNSPKICVKSHPRKPREVKERHTAPSIPKNIHYLLSIIELQSRSSDRTAPHTPSRRGRSAAAAVRPASGGWHRSEPAA